MPCFASKSSAGPDAGVPTFTFGFGDTRVKLEVTKDPASKFGLREKDSGFSIMENDKEFVRGVKVLPTLAHAPNQAFINLSNRCKFGCAFCSFPTGREEVSLGPERVLRIVGIALNSPDFEAISITSGVPDSSTKTNHRVSEVTRTLKIHYPEYPIGIEVYFEHSHELELLKNSGADEIKINIEVWPKDLYKKVCPARSRRLTLSVLEEAVEVFGKGKVTSNMIVGLGETDEDVAEGLEALACMGVVPNLRALRINKANEKRLGEALGRPPERVSAERLLALADIHKKALEKHGLTPKTFQTMCFSCGCCDIVPMIDW